MSQSEQQPWGPKALWSLVGVYVSAGWTMGCHLLGSQSGMGELGYVLWTIGLCFGMLGIFTCAALHGAYTILGE